VWGYNLAKEGSIVLECQVTVEPSEKMYCEK